MILELLTKISSTAQAHVPKMQIEGFIFHSEVVLELIIIYIAYFIGCTIYYVYNLINNYSICKNNTLLEEDRATNTNLHHGNSYI